MTTASLRRAAPGLGQDDEASASQLRLREPTLTDGPAVHALIRACPPLDENSAYCNLLQCSHFAGTCVVAADAEGLVGWISAHILPAEPDVVFVWQVAVAPRGRGLGLGGRMLDELLSRPACAAVRRMKTSVTEGNGPSWSMFGRLAERLGAPLSREPWMLEDVHLPGGLPTEHLVTIGPFAAPAQA